MSDRDSPRNTIRSNTAGIRKLIVTGPQRAEPDSTLRRIARWRTGQRTVRVMDGTGSPGAASDEPEARQQKPAGAWAGYLIFALCLMVLIVLDARAAYDHSWAQFTGISAVILAFAIVCD